MNRTAERVLSIIALVFTALALIPSFLLILFGKMLSDENIQNEVTMDLKSDPQFTSEDVDIVLSLLDGVGTMSWLGWGLVFTLIISIVMTIIGMVAIWNNKNPKLAGIMFIVAGLFAFVLSLGSILLYIAAILCFTKKAPTPPMVEEVYDGDMRPL